MEIYLDRISESFTSLAKNSGIKHDLGVKKATMILSE